MEKFFASFLFALFVLVAFIYGVRQSALEHGRSVSDLYFDEARKAIKFDPTDEEMINGYPFLIEGEIEREETDMLVMNFKYLVPPGDRNSYRISFSPPSSDFQSDDNRLESGANVVRVSVYFQPESRFRRVYKGKVLGFYIYKKVAVNQEQMVFARRAIFEKDWRRSRRRVVPMLRRAEYHVK